MARSARYLLLVALLPAACSTDTVELAYRLEPGTRLEHRLVLRAEITRTLQGQTREQDVVAAFRASQEVTTPLETGGAEAAVSLTPESLEVDGRPVEVGPGQEFVVQLGADGRVVAIQGAGGGDPEPLQPVGLERLLPRLRPVLPGTPVAPGDTWRSQTEFIDENGRFSLSTTSRLTQLGITDGREAALVRTTYESPVDRRETFANAVADMTGTDLGAQEAWFSLNGFLIRASGDSMGSYRVIFSPPGEGETGLAPVEGSLTVRMHTEMTLLSAA